MAEIHHARGETERALALCQAALEEAAALLQSIGKGEEENASVDEQKTRGMKLAREACEVKAAVHHGLGEHEQSLAVCNTWIQALHTSDDALDTHFTQWLMTATDVYTYLPSPNTLYAGAHPWHAWRPQAISPHGYRAPRGRRPCPGNGTVPQGVHAFHSPFGLSLSHSLSLSLSLGAEIVSPWKSTII